MEEDRGWRRTEGGGGRMNTIKRVTWKGDEGKKEEAKDVPWRGRKEAVNERKTKKT